MKQEMMGWAFRSKEAFQCEYKRLREQVSGHYVAVILSHT